MEQFIVKIVEYERDWGSRVDEVRTFPCLTAARAFVRQFNRENREATTPDWYMKAELVLT